MPTVVDVEAAAWHHPYHFSGRLPLRALALMVGVGVPMALIAGVVGYFGGAVSGWIGSHAIDIGLTVASGLSQSGFIGNGVGLAVQFCILLFGVVFVGILYPVLIGALAGSGVAFGAKAGKSRKPWVAGLLGLLAGGLAYAAFVGTALLMNAPLHESSRILEAVSPPLSYGLMVIDGLIVVIVATMTAHSANEAPYCESCEKWYGAPKTTTIPIEGATPLVEALASGSAGSLQALPTQVTDPDVIKLDLSRCECGQSDYNLVATVHWCELKQDKEGKTSSESKARAWFSTTLPASLGAEIERWWTPQPLPAAA
ncbi:MAG: hypothetical protein ACXWWU_00800 [Candidatus Limnocylindria bacterium]